MWVPVAVWQPCELLYTCYLLTFLVTVGRDSRCVSRQSRRTRQLTRTWSARCKKPRPSSLTPAVSMAPSAFSPYLLKLATFKITDIAPKLRLNCFCNNFVHRASILYIFHCCDEEWFLHTPVKKNFPPHLNYAVTLPEKSDNRRMTLSPTNLKWQHSKHVVEMD